MSYKISLIILKEWLKEKYDEVKLLEDNELYIELTAQELLDFTSLYMKKEVYKIIDRCEIRGKMGANDLKKEVRALYDSLSANQKDIKGKYD